MEARWFLAGLAGLMTVVSASAPAVAPAVGVGTSDPVEGCAAVSVAVLAGAESGPGVWTFLVAFVDPCAPVGSLPGGALPFEGAFSLAGGGCLADTLAVGFTICFDPTSAAPPVYEYDVAFCCPAGTGSVTLVGA